MWVTWLPFHPNTNNPAIGGENALVTYIVKGGRNRITGLCEADVKYMSHVQ